MIQIQRFTFNDFMVNTYLLWDETLDAVLIDAACYDQEEQKELREFIERKGLRLVENLNTHCHVDHVLGNEFVAAQFGVNPRYHQDSEFFFQTVREIGSSFGFRLGNIPKPAGYLEDGQTVTWGHSSLTVLFTPGHANGHVCFYQPEQGFVITGDVLFKDTIGRTDLPSGNFDLLMQSIKNKLFTLPEDTIVWPGHGPDTTIGYESRNNPFIR
jgi:glyoxylase-like metal-dependent hydrolase (beta-lactamase superfamily II)